MASNQLIEGESLPYKNLTFKKANSESELPFVFSQYFFTMNAVETGATGMIRGYYPLKKGTNGVWHRVNVTSGDSLLENVRETSASGVPGTVKPGTAHLPVPSMFYG